MAKGSLEEFIRNYISNGIVSGEIKSIGDFMKESEGEEISHSQDYIKADTHARLSRGGYGILNEKLFDRGLLNSGYRDYLDTISAKLGAGARADFLSKQKTKAQDTRVSDYADYLKKYEALGEKEYNAKIKAEAAEAEAKAKAEAKEKAEAEAKAKAEAEAKAKAEAEEKKKKEAEAAAAEKAAAAYKKSVQKATDKIISSETINYDAAYKIAIDCGLTDEDAKKVATEASATARENLKKEIAERIISKTMTKNAAYSYAIKMGLTEEEAEELGNLAKEANQTVPSDTSDSYLDYLRELDEKKRQEK